MFSCTISFVSNWTPIEKPFPKLTLRVLSFFLNTRKQAKHLPFSFVLLGVSSCVENLMKHRHSFMKHYVKSQITLQPFESSCGGPKNLTPSSFLIHCYSFEIDNPDSTVKYANKLFTCRSKEVMHKFVLNR